MTCQTLLLFVCSANCQKVQEFLKSLHNSKRNLQIRYKSTQFNIHLNLNAFKDLSIYNKELSLNKICLIFSEYASRTKLIITCDVIPMSLCWSRRINSILIDVLISTDHWRTPMPYLDLSIKKSQNSVNFLPHKIYSKSY